jgi:hypothetical protein
VTTARAQAVSDGKDVDGFTRVKAEERRIDVQIAKSERTRGLEEGWPLLQAKMAELIERRGKV